MRRFAEKAEGSPPRYALPPSGAKGKRKISLEALSALAYRLRGADLRKEVMPMVQFLWDAAAQAVAGIVVALFVYWLNRR